MFVGYISRRTIIFGHRCHILTVQHSSSYCYFMSMSNKERSVLMIIRRPSYYYSACMFVGYSSRHTYHLRILIHYYLCLHGRIACEDALFVGKPLSMNNDSNFAILPSCSCSSCMFESSISRCTHYRWTQTPDFHCRHNLIACVFTITICKRIACSQIFHS